MSIWLILTLTVSAFISILSAFFDLRIRHAAGGPRLRPLGWVFIGSSVLLVGCSFLLARHQILDANAKLNELTQQINESAATYEHAIRKISSLGIRVTIKIPKEREKETLDTLIDECALYLITFHIKAHLEYKFSFTAETPPRATVSMWPLDRANEATSHALHCNLSRTHSGPYELLFWFDTNSTSQTSGTILGDLNNANASVEVEYFYPPFPRYDPKNIFRVELVAEPTTESDQFRLACFDIAPDDWQPESEFRPLRLRRQSTTIKIAHQAGCTHHPAWGE